MEKLGIFLIFMILCMKYALSTLYACPPTSLCVPPNNCKPENVTFNALTNKDQEHQYVCGILAQCEDNICCSEPINLPTNFESNKINWCYQQSEAFPDTLSMDIQVILYPGMEDPKPKEKLHHIPSLCPTGSVCVPGSLCPLEYITYAFGVSSEEFTCGNHSGSDGNICCTISGTFELSHSVPESKPKFMKVKKIESRRSLRQSQWSFVNSDYYAANNVVVGKGQVYTGISGKSLNTQDWFCGRTLNIAGELNRIYAPIGDREAKEGDYPWHVAILSSTYEYLCSGVIIAERVVVSIAHCFDKHKTSDILVRVGDLNLKLESEKNPAFDVKVKHLIIHPNYDRINLDADIAIIEMEESVKSLPHVRPACLPQSGFSPLINKCKVPGWGQFSKSKHETNEFNYALRAASFYIIDNSQCQNSLRKVKELGAFFKLQKRVLCAKGYSNSDTCKGDGGSGLVCRDKDVYVLKGLVSYGFGCGLDLPGVYTDVEKYLDFIRNYKKFIPISSSNVDYVPSSSKTEYQFSKDFDSSYAETIRPASETEGYKEFGRREPEKIPQYIHVLEEDSYKQDKEKVYDVHNSIKNHINEPIETNFINGNQYVDIPDDESHTKVEYINPEYDANGEYINPEYDTKVKYIKQEVPGYVEKSDYNSYLYLPEGEIEIYPQGSANNLVYNRDEYGIPLEENYISRPETGFTPTDFLYDVNDRYLYEDYKPSLKDYSSESTIRDYGSIYDYDSNPNYDEEFYDSTLSNSRHDKFGILSNSRYDEPSYQPEIYEQPNLVYQPTYEVENSYSNFDESYPGTSGTTIDEPYDRTSQHRFDNSLYYGDLDHLKFRRGLRKSSKIAPKNAKVNAYTKKVSGKAPEQFANILNTFSSYETPVREGRVLSPLAILRRHLNYE